RWLQSKGLTIRQTFSSRLLVSASGNAGEIDSAFHVSLQRYRARPGSAGPRSSQAAPERPSLPWSVGQYVRTVFGLTTLPLAVAAPARALPTPRRAGARKEGSKFGLFPSDFRAIYGVPVSDTGAGVHVGIVMWCDAPSDAALKSWGTNTK